MKTTKTVRRASSGERERSEAPKRNTVISLKEERPKKAKHPLKRLARIGPVAPDGPGAVRTPPPKAPKQPVAKAPKPRATEPPKPRATKAKARRSQPAKPGVARRQSIVLSGPRNALPGWHDLATGEPERYRMRARHASFLETISTARFGLLILVIAIAFTGYVGHVYATQNLLVERQLAEKENLRLHLRHNRLKGLFDQTTGPAMIYSRAKEMGLEEGIIYGPTIEVAGR